MDAKVETISINGIDYVPAGSVPKPKPNGKRAVVVADRGWIFAGDVTEANGRIRLARAVHVFSWSGIGFAKMLQEWKSSKVDLRAVADVDFPSGAEIFRVPVADDWGIK